MYVLTGSPFRGLQLDRLRRFLRSCDLDYDEGVRFTAVLMEDDEIVATGSLDGATIKCVAVSPAHQGEDAASRVMTVLLQKAAETGIHHLMLYTKPQNGYIFGGFGFHTVIRTADCLLMENRRDGLKRFLADLARPKDERKPVGCIVANCNPFTNGHRYLIENAARQCAWVHLFILSEEKGMFSPEERMRMVKEGCSDLKNVIIHPTGPYMVSSATFPSYFIKDKLRTGDIHCEMDIRLFGERIAPVLSITRRYVGTEPECAVTGKYNERMKEMLPACGIELIEIPRKEWEGRAVSASDARRLIENKQWNLLEDLLPESSLNVICAKEGDASWPIHSECSGI
ncbi:MAG: [Clostridia bacterium]|nr:[citrate (pro-3S)-lyase] ligase [Clostridia bacterium]